MQHPSSDANTPDPEEGRPDLDLIGTSCPMAFVKARIFLDQKPAGEHVSILYEDTRANEPLIRSIEALGHIVHAQIPAAIYPSAPQPADGLTAGKLQAIRLSVQVKK